MNPISHFVSSVYMKVASGFTFLSCDMQKVLDFNIFLGKTSLKLYNVLNNMKTKF